LTSFRKSEGSRWRGELISFVRSYSASDLEEPGAGGVGFEPTSELPR
jgi:hypothetical protein